ncbi:hypothetical protein CO614_07445 [Lysobacteraceae bacterium NML120232]|nr:hypothetical protein CO614_07445 [Xanthomonadaceae bacterium NML120232]
MKIPMTLLAGVALLLGACDKTPSTTHNPAAPGCLQYALGAVTLSGLASTERISAPDKGYREALILTLDAPICVSAKAGQAAEFPAHPSVTRLELLPKSDFADAFSLAGQRVSAHGNLAPLSGDGAAAPLGLVLRSLKAEPGAQPAESTPPDTTAAPAADATTN